MAGKVTRTVDDRFWEKVKKTDTCWNWTAARFKSGYGAFRIGGRDGATVYAHRFSYELLAGPIPEGLPIDHLCRNVRCVNPDHLEPVTQAENTRRADGGGYNRRKTHCPRGHEYNDANTYVGKSGSRFCRACDKQRPRRKGW